MATLAPAPPAEAWADPDAGTKPSISAKDEADQLMVVAETCAKLERTQEAITTLHDAARLYSEALGPSAEETLTALRELAVVHEGSRDYTLALSTYQELLERREAASGDKCKSTYGVIIAVGRLQYKLKKHKKAFRTFLRAQAIIEQVYPPDDVNAGQNCVWLARCLTAQFASTRPPKTFELTNCKEWLERAIEIAHANPESQLHQTLPKMYSLRCDVYEYSGDLVGAIKGIDEALAWISATLGSSHPRIASLTGKRQRIQSKLEEIKTSPHQAGRKGFMKRMRRSGSASSVQSEEDEVGDRRIRRSGSLRSAHSDSSHSSDERRRSLNLSSEEEEEIKRFPDSAASSPCLSPRGTPSPGRSKLVFMRNPTSPKASSPLLPRTVHVASTETPDSPCVSDSEQKQGRKSKMLKRVFKNRKRDSPSPPASVSDETITRLERENQWLRQQLNAKLQDKEESRAFAADVHKQQLVQAEEINAGLSERLSLALARIDQLEAKPGALSHCSASALEALVILHQEAMTATQTALLRVQEQVMRTKVLAENREVTKCKICFDSAVEVCLKPCGHVCLCKKCGERLDSCPLCREPITEILQVYLE